MSTSSSDPGDAIVDSAAPLLPPPDTAATAIDPHPLTEPAGTDQTVSSTPIRARPGDLTARWRTMVGAAWVVAFFAYAAVWQASVQIGIGTWWLGPRAQPTSVVVRVLPFVLCLVLAMCAVYNTPRLVRLSAVGVLLAAVGALPDFSRSIGLGVTEMVIAALLGVVTAAATTGRYRQAPATEAPPPPTT